MFVTALCLAGAAPHLGCDREPDPPAAPTERAASPATTGTDSDRATTEPASAGGPDAPSSAPGDRAASSDRAAGSDPDPRAFRRRHGPGAGKGHGAGGAGRGPGRRGRRTDSSGASRFARAADSCVDCHSASPNADALRDTEGRSVAPYDEWQGSMMANAARDPFWRAQVAWEVADLSDEDAAAIEGECMGCHAPTLAIDARNDGLPAPRTASLDGNERPALLGRDGVTCTVCHQAQPEGLGTEDTFGGRFAVDDHREIFGPYPDPWGEVMRNRSGYTPTHGPHVSEAGLCGSCHTLFTTPHGADDDTRFAEQTIYLEWRNSRFDTERESPEPGAATCQGCHMLRRGEDGELLETRIARNPWGGDFGRIAPRTPFSRHLFVGGNTLVPRLLEAHADELDVRASPDALQATVAAAREQLATRTATLDLQGRFVEIDGDTFITVDVTVTNLTGHKFPAGFPSRRAWLELEVIDAHGKVVFRSGAHDARGRILDAEGTPWEFEAAGGPLPPHRRSIGRTPGVAIWTAIAADVDGAPTFKLTRSAAWALDNRLLPGGWQPDGPWASLTAPVGMDLPEVPGVDHVTYEVLPEGKAPWTVRGTLHYQTVGARHLAELAANRDVPAIGRFLEMLEGIPPLPEPVATASVTLRDER